ncbi:four helix bundle protein [Thioalkalivibrio sulfidiphilus]|uniref:four helix bundle protein n=1 Tax=Thioalkalivibrio sulfidiphilus TaxID=1033854 RepID=UPI003B34CC4F
MERANCQKLRIYVLAEQLSDSIWGLVIGWERLARDTVGMQLVRAADSVGANIAEGAGRGSLRDSRRFARIARGSLSEVQHWLRRAYRRGLLSEDHTRQLKPVLDELAPKLNAYLRSIDDRLSRG